MYARGIRESPRLSLKGFRNEPSFESLPKLALNAKFSSFCQRMKVATPPLSSTDQMGEASAAVLDATPDADPTIGAREHNNRSL
jgi:hypothetical protein